jgi:hypothetical protein
LKGNLQKAGHGTQVHRIREDDQNYLRNFINEQLTSDIVTGLSKKTDGVELDLTKSKKPA